MQEDKGEESCKTPSSADDPVFLNSDTMFEKQVSPSSMVTHIAEAPESLFQYWLIRLPLQMAFTCLILFQLLWYFTFRWLVRFLEKACVPRHVRKLKWKLQNASNYDEWLAAASALDAAAGCDCWRAEARSRHYVSGRVEAAIARVRSGVASSDARMLMRDLRTCFQEPNFAGVLNEHLYSQSHVGTKHLVEEYVDAVAEACEVLGSLVENCNQEHLPAEEARSIDTDLRRQLGFLIESVAQSFGKTALCLSGGGAMALQHLGVCHALLQQQCLPQVISGTSGGALCAALMCTRTDEELQQILTPEHIQPQCKGLGDSWQTCILRFLRTGHLFDAEAWFKDMNFWANGNMTFLEAYERTGRVLNVTASARKPHVIPLVLNFRNTPHVLIRSALLCSSAMPIFIKAPRLLEKNPQNGHIMEAYSEDGSHAPLYQDGSIDCDIPAEELRVAFGVRFTIVSQVNPHVLPFRFDEHGDSGEPVLQGTGRVGIWRGGFILSGLVILIKEHMIANLRLLSRIHLVPQVFETRWDLMWSQQYRGDINLCNTGGLGTYLWKVRKALSNPTMEEMRYWWHEGEKISWPKLARIHVRLRQERGFSMLQQASGMVRQPTPPLI